MQLSLIDFDRTGLKENCTPEKKVCVPFIFRISRRCSMRSGHALGRLAHESRKVTVRLNTGRAAVESIGSR